MARRVRYSVVAIVVLAFLVGSGSAPASAAVPNSPTAVAAVVQGSNLLISWSPPSDASGVTGYRVATSPAGPVVTVGAGADHAVLTGVRPNTPYTVSVVAVAGAEDSAPATTGPVQTLAPGGSLQAVTPARLLDTRTGLGAAKGRTRQVTVTVAGRGGLPSSGIAAVAVNLTVNAPTGSGFVTAYPTGIARPTVSNLNYTAGQTVANLAVVPVGADGKIALYSSASTHLIADVAGWYSQPAGASPGRGLFHGLQPSRLADTRIGLGGATPGPAATLDLQVTGAGGVPATGVSAVVLNTTIAGGTQGGYVAAYPTGVTRPLASTVNFVKGQVVANRVIVPVGAGGKVSFFNAAGSTPLVIDVTGWYTDGTDPSAGGAYLRTVTPTRVVDTRIGVGAAKAPIGPGASLSLVMAGHAGLPAARSTMPATGVVANVTAVAPTKAGYLTVYPSLTTRPTASDLNFKAKAIVPGLAMGLLGVDGNQLIYNPVGQTNVLVDVVGYFVGDVATPSSTVVAAAGDIVAVAGAPGGAQQVTLALGRPGPAVGETIVSGATPQTPNGLIARVTETSIDGTGRVVLDTAPVPLNQALGDAHFSISIPLSSTDIASASGGAPTPGLTPDIVRDRLTGGSPTVAVSQPINRALSCTAGGSVTVTGSIGVNPTFNLSADWGWTGLKSASFTGTLTETASLTASAHAAASCTVGPVALLPTPIRFAPIMFWIGPVPVVVTPQLQFYLSAAGDVTADITASAVQTAAGTLGVFWIDGVLYPIALTTSDFTYTKPTPTETATVSAKVGPRFDLLIYGLAGPYLTADASLTLTADLWPTLEWTLTGGLDSGAGITIPFLDFDEGNPSILHYEKVIARYSSPQHVYAIECISIDCATTMRLVRTDESGGALEIIGSTFGGAMNGFAVNPDGTEVVISRSDEVAGGLVLFVRDIATGQDRQLTSRDPGCDGSTVDGYPVWSPDGNWISFQRNSVSDEGTCVTDGLYRVPAAGGAIQLIAPNSFGSPPSWNPEMTRWAITSNESSPPSLFTTTVANADQHVLRANASDDGLSPASWSPDGSTIAVGTASGLAVGVTPDGGQLFTYALTDYCGAYPLVWSRDSDSLYYVGCGSAGQYTVIHRLDVATGSTTPITFGHNIAAVGTGP